jgi:hypothetical protein
MMEAIYQTWPQQAVDSISIYASASNLRLQGGSDSLLRLEGRVNQRHEQTIKLDPSAHRLKVSLPHDRGSELTLTLPSSKAWQVELTGGRSNIKVSNLLARLNITIGKGEVEITDLKGKLAITSGNSNVNLKHFCQSEMPENSPTQPDTPLESERAGDRDWLHWSDSEWESWGENLGERITGWAAGMARLVGPRVDDRNAGLSLVVGRGNAQLTDVEMKTGIVKLLRGNLDLQEIRANNLQMYLSHGDVNGKSLVPAGSWSVKTSHGNVRVSLPADLGARLDMATRHGNIGSEASLVKVSRQGPETSSGTRMVGTVGPASEGVLPELRISATHGDIEIDSKSPGMKNGREVQARELVLSGVGSVSLGGSVEAGSNITAPAPETPLAVLEGLQKGTINLTEAEQLLRSFTL